MQDFLIKLKSTELKIEFCVVSLFYQVIIWLSHSCQQQQNIVVNFHQDFIASKHSNFFQGQTDRGLFYGPNHWWETRLSKENEEEDYCFSISIAHMW